MISSSMHQLVHLYTLRMIFSWMLPVVWAFYAIQRNAHLQVNVLSLLALNSTLPLFLNLRHYHDEDIDEYLSCGLWMRVLTILSPTSRV
jgi:hypothetical protein